MFLGMTLFTGFLMLMAVIGVIWLIGCIIWTAAKIFFRLAGLLILLPVLILVFSAVF